MDSEKMNAIEVLRAFEIDVDHDGGALFVELVYLLVAQRRWVGREIRLNKVVKELQSKKGMLPRNFYGQMKRSLRPILLADAEILEAFDLYPAKRTTGQMALAFAERELRIIYDQCRT